MYGSKIFKDAKAKNDLWVTCFTHTNIFQTKKKSKNLHENQVYSFFEYGQAKWMKKEWSRTSKSIEEEVRKLIDEGYARAKKILTDQNDDLHTLAKALLEYESLSGDEIKDLLAGKPIIRDFDDEPGDDTPKSSVPSSTSTPDGGELPQGV